MKTYLMPGRDFNYQQAEDQEELPRGVNIHGIHLRLTGNLDVGQTTAGAASGTMLTEPTARLIQRFRIQWDGVDIVEPLTGRDLAALYNNCVAQAIAATEPANMDTQNDTAIERWFYIPFARPYLQNPFETVLPILPIRQQLRMYLQWETAKSNAVAGTTVGSAAFVNATNDRSVDAQNVKLEVMYEVSEAPFRPWYIPTIRVAETEQFTAANTRLPLKVRVADRFDMVLFQQMYGSNLLYQNAITDMTFIHSGRRPIDKIIRQMLVARERIHFPAVGSRTGIVSVLMADGGKLRTVPNPRVMHDPTFEFNVAAPTSSPGRIRAIYMGLMANPQVTASAS